MAVRIENVEDEVFASPPARIVGYVVEFLLHDSCSVIGAEAVQIDMLIGIV